MISQAMEGFEKKVAVLLILAGISLMGVVYSFTQQYMEVSDLSCELQCGMDVAENCPHRSGLPLASYVGFTSSSAILLVSLYLLFFRKREKGILWIHQKNPKLLKSLGHDENTVFRVITDSGGAVLQREIIERTGFSKAKVSRILDRLEVKGLVERRRSGMSNLVILRRR